MYKVYSLFGRNYNLSTTDMKFYTNSMKMSCERNKCKIINVILNINIKHLLKTIAINVLKRHKVNNMTLQTLKCQGKHVV